MTEEPQKPPENPDEVWWKRRLSALVAAAYLLMAALFLWKTYRDKGLAGLGLDVLLIVIGLAVLYALSIRAEGHWKRQARKKRP